MASRVARWAFAAVYGIVALIAVWGGVVQLNPPAPPANPPFDPNPVIYVNSAMFTAGMFYFLTALAFGACAYFAVQDARANRADGLVKGLNTAFSAFLAIVGVYLTWYGAQLLMLGGSFAYALSGVALLASAFFLFIRKPLGALIYAGILAFWVVMSILEAGLDFIALLPRLAGVGGGRPVVPVALASRRDGQDEPRRRSMRAGCLSALQPLLRRCCSWLAHSRDLSGCRRHEECRRDRPGRHRLAQLWRRARRAALCADRPDQCRHRRQAGEGVGVPHRRRLRLQADAADGQWHGLSLHGGLDADRGRFRHRPGSLASRDTDERAGRPQQRRPPSHAPAAALAITRRRRPTRANAPSASLRARSMRACWRSTP